MSSMPRQRLWKFSSVMPKAPVREGRLQGRHGAGEGQAGVQLQEGDAQRPGLLPGQGQALRAGVAGGQGDPQHPLRAQVLGGHGGHHGAVDAARRGPPPPPPAPAWPGSPAGPCPGPGAARPPRPGSSGQGAPAPRVSTMTTPSRKNSSRCQVPSGLRQAGAAVEGEPALGAHPGGVGDGDAVLGGVALEQPLAQGQLGGGRPGRRAPRRQVAAQVAGAGRGVEDQGGALPGQVGDGVEGVADRPGARTRGWPRGPRRWRGRSARPGSPPGAGAQVGLEVAALVEDVVDGQDALAGHRPHPAVLAPPQLVPEPARGRGLQVPKTSGTGPARAGQAPGLGRDPAGAGRPPRAGPRPGSRPRPSPGSAPVRRPGPGPRA